MSDEQKANIIEERFSFLFLPLFLSALLPPVSGSNWSRAQQISQVAAVNRKIQFFHVPNSVDTIIDYCKQPPRATTEHTRTQKRRSFTYRFFVLGIWFLICIWFWCFLCLHRACFVRILLFGCCTSGLNSQMKFDLFCGTSKKWTQNRHTTKSVRPRREERTKKTADKEMTYERSIKTSYR